MKKIIILDENTEEVHVFTLPEKYYEEPIEFVLEQCSQDGITFKMGMCEYMVLDLSESEGRLPIYIH